MGESLPLTLVAGLGHASLGSVDWALLAQLLAGSLPGIWLGSRLQSFNTWKGHPNCIAPGKRPRRRLCATG